MALKCFWCWICSGSGFYQPPEGDGPVALWGSWSKSQRKLQIFQRERKIVGTHLDKDNGLTFVMHVLKKWSFPPAGSKEQFKEICGLLLWRDWIFINLSRHGHGLKPSHSEPWEPCWCLQLGANMSRFSLGCSSSYDMCHAMQNPRG